ncbi:MAG: hypothetical protein FK732_02650, partial [Asgard group archaeon]|nr:hypothetical protein [Asgard group archaeon]
MSSIIDLSNFDLLDITNEVEAVLHAPIYYFPIRHHSPICAWQTLHAIQKRQPKVICLEIPNNFQPLGHFLIDPGTRPPIALYSAYKDEKNLLGGNGIFSHSPDIPAKYQSWLPFVNYSPEYQVLKFAQTEG